MLCLAANDETELEGRSHRSITCLCSRFDSRYRPPSACLQSRDQTTGSGRNRCRQRLCHAVRFYGHIAARIDRLPLTRVQWHLAILVEVTWGFIIFDTDGIGARLYPFVWRPNHIIDVYQYAVIQALQVGAGILLGVYLMSWVADRYGRRPAILLATLLGGICIWPFAYVTNFWGMVVLSVLSTLGVGGIVATHSVYLSEMTSPDVRNKVLLASQGVTALVAVSVNMLAFWLIPSQWQAFLWISAIIEIVVLLPLLYFKLPELPRWLEAHGRHEEAERAVEEYERAVQRYDPRPLAGTARSR